MSFRLGVMIFLICGFIIEISGRAYEIKMADCLDKYV